jgi:hypothetical protein
MNFLQVKNMQVLCSFSDFRCSVRFNRLSTQPVRLRKFVMPPLVQTLLSICKVKPAEAGREAASGLD